MEPTVSFFKLLQYRAALKLEIAVLRMSSNRSVYAHVKRQFGWKGNKQAILAKLESAIAKAKQE